MLGTYVRAFARPLLLIGAVALLVDLFLDWRIASLTTASLDLRAGTSGWPGWGAVAGALLIALIAWELRLLYLDVQPTSRNVLLSAVLAVAAAGFAFAGFFTGSASVDVAGTVTVSTDEVRIAAYVGLVLAAVVALAAVVRLATELRVHPLAGTPTRPSPA